MKMKIGNLLLIACALALAGCNAKPTTPASNDAPAVQDSTDKVLVKWDGMWAGNDGSWLKVTGARWSTGYGEVTTYEGRLNVIETQSQRTLVDMPVEVGKTKGQTIKAIFRQDGDRLLYCGTYDLPRPTEFVKGERGDPWFVEYKRQQK